MDKDLWYALDRKLSGTVKEVFPKIEQQFLENIFFSPPKDSGHGDLACSAAMMLAKPMRANPRSIAEQLVAKIDAWPEIAETEIAGPGFINVRLADQVLHQEIVRILHNPNNFSHSDLGAGQSVNVEYVSVNPTGPLHIGHARGAVFGDALSALLARIGYQVTREYYINDAGMQVDVLARSAYMRYLEAAGEGDQVLTAPLYPGAYLIPVGEALYQKFGDELKTKAEAEWLPVVRDFVIDQMMDIIREDLLLLGIKQDVFSSEKRLVDSGEVERTLEELQQKGVVYRGILEPPKGKMPEDWEPREQLLFRTTDFGDDTDRALIKSDGSYSYFMPDITYHRDKLKRGFFWLINIFGADHIGYVKRLKAAVAAFSDVPLDILCVQIVRFMENGEPVRMSKRQGKFISLRELIEAVGKDVVRLHLLSRKNDAHMDFDLELVKQQSLDNPVFYMQYAHARCHSSIQHAKDVFPEADFDTFSDHLLLDPHAHRLLCKLAEYPAMLRRAGSALEVHRLALYLRELAKELHSYWNYGKDQAELRVVIRDDFAKTQSRVTLMKAVKLVLADGLRLLGVSAVDELR